MAKKKKAQLKAPHRGFTTTSVPKKVVDPPMVEDAVVGESNDANPGDDKPPDLGVQEQEREEFQQLQRLVDKEVVRTLKAIETDRRYTSTLPTLELDSAVVDRVLSLFSESDVAEGRKKLGESEDRMLTKLGITYGVLRRLGFSESRVIECLQSISSVELDDEVFDWLYSNCSALELECIPHALNENSNEPTTPIPYKTSHDRPRTPLTSTEFAIIPPMSDEGRTETINISDEEDRLQLKRKILDSLNENESDSDEDHPNMQYARLKLALEQNLPQHSAANTRKHMSALAKNVFFDQEKAQELYNREREKPSVTLKSITVAQTRPPESVKGEVTHDVFEDDDEVGLFDILEPLQDVTTSEGTVVRIREMSLPKHWSGRTPKTLLLERVFGLDRYAATTFTIISGSSRARRAAVNIRWKKKTQEWSMSDVACPDDNQAEQYIATVALHALVYPSLEGFASTPGLSSVSTSFRQLPPTYRDLWDELEESRKIREESVNREIWSNLRSILKEKQESNAKSSGKVTKQPLTMDVPVALKSHSQSSPEPDQELINDFRAKMANTTFQEMLVQRNSLPIANYRQEIIETLNRSQILVLSGETGCGKSTQVPSFILEDQLLRGKPCKIYCTEPRRLSAVSLAQRVSLELGEPPGALGTARSLVGYSIRLANETSKNTRLAFITNGIALRMLEGGTGSGSEGTAFDEVTHIIIDEVHERTIESDFLLIVLKSLLTQRTDLKIILMSATVDAEKIAEFFGSCPILLVPGRTFPVDVHYLEDALEYTQWSISEDSPYARRQHDKFYNGKNRIDWSEELAVLDDEDSDRVNENLKLEKRYSASTAATINLLDERIIPYDLIVRLLEKVCFEDSTYLSFSGAILVFMPGLAEIRKLNDLLSEHPNFGTDSFTIHQLHSTISTEVQSAAFEVPPNGVRKIVIATNICETGVTIKDITLVIDTGKHREMRFDEKRQLSRLIETFIAKSNAAQRRGRAGRVQPGVCFHLFTKFRHDNQLVDHPLPEMLRLSLADLALRIKIMKVKLGSSIEDVLLRALDPPVRVNIQRAIETLVEVRALTPSEELTPLGRKLASIPTDVHLGKFLLIATIFGCLDPALTIVATLNSKSPFVTPFGLEQDAARARNSFRLDNSDFLTMHNAFSAWRRVCSNPAAVRKWCRTNFCSHQNLLQIEELRQALLSYLIDSSCVQVDKAFIRELNKTRYSKNRNRFITVPAELNVNSSNNFLTHAALAAGLYPKILAVDFLAGQLRTITNNQQAYFHPSSVNFGKKPIDMGVQYLSYFTLMHSKKLYAWETGPTDSLALVLMCGEPEFKLISEGVFVDRKVRYHAAPKTCLALKCLRTQLASLLGQQFRNKPLTESQIIWRDMANLVLNKSKVIEDEDAGQKPG